MKPIVLSVCALLAVGVLAVRGLAQTGSYGAPGNFVECAKRCCGNERCFGTVCEACVRACAYPRPEPQEEQRFKLLQQQCTTYSIKGYNKPK